MSAEYLWVVPKWPWPVLDGARRATESLLRAWIAQGVQVSLLFFARPEEMPSPEEQEGIRQKWGLKKVHGAVLPAGRGRLGLALLSLGSRWGATYLPFSRACLPPELGPIESYERVILDGLHGGAPWAGKISSRFVYRAHNLETELWQSAATNAAWFLKPIYRWQASRVQAWEREVVSSSAGVAAISSEDAREFGRISKHVKFVPLGQELPPLATPSRSRSPGERVLGFLGKLDWEPNRDGLTWFLAEIWPKVSGGMPAARLVVAGGGEEPRSLAQARAVDPRIVFLGRVDSLSRFYESVDVCLAPIRIGSGTRIKVIEALAYGKPVVGTPLGCQGTGLDAGAPLFRAEAPGEWAKAIERALDPRTVNDHAERARQCIAEALDPHVIARDFARWLHKLPRSVVSGLQ